MDTQAPNRDATVDLVVVNYRTPGDLGQFLSSVEDTCCTQDISLTVVNVCPTTTDAEVAEVGAEYLRGLGYIVHTFEFGNNVGYARACNFGAEAGHGDVLAFFNADVVLTKDAVAKCAGALRAEPTWAALGPRQVDVLEGGRITHGGIFGTDTKPKFRGWRERDRAQYRDVLEAITIAGSAYFVKRAVWGELTACPTYRQFCDTEELSSVGAFLPTTHFYEETWCSYHARAHDWKVMYYGLTTIVHKWHQASPVGGWAEQQIPASRKLFRSACDAHGLAHD